MRALIALFIVVIASPTFAQFPPPGVYACTGDDGVMRGMLTLLVGGDYQWSAADGSGGEGQVNSAGNTVEAITGPLDDAHWVGTFAEEMGAASYAFETDSGPVACALPN